jgi:hypothetical protein
MANHEITITKDRMLTETELAAYGIPPKQSVEPTRGKTGTDTKEERTK